MDKSYYDVISVDQAKIELDRAMQRNRDLANQINDLSAKHQEESDELAECLELNQKKIEILKKRLHVRFS